MSSSTIPEWLSYQREAAALFRTLGFEAQVDVDVQGARATHAIDVCVRFTHAGLPCLWIVECKRWTSPIPKEKVLALQQIAQDVGADRAILLSESGFQSGAFKAAVSTNVTLTSLSELGDAARELGAQHALKSLAASLHGLDGRLKDHFFDEMPSRGRALTASFDDLLSLSGVVLMLTQDWPKAQAGAFPLLGTTDVGTVRLADMAAFVDHATRMLAVVEAGVVERDCAAARRAESARTAFDELVAAVRSLLQVGEAALFAAPGHGDIDPNRTAVVAAMRRVGDAALALRGLAGSNTRMKLGALMPFLHDVIYLQLSAPAGSVVVWKHDCERAFALLTDVDRAIADSPPAH